MELVASKNLKEKISTKRLKAITLILLFFLFLGTNNASVYYSELMPFGISIAFCLVYMSFNGYVISILFACSYLILNWDINSIIITTCVVLVLIITQYLCDRKRVLLQKWSIALLLLLSLIGFVAVNIGGIKENLAVFVSVVLAEFLLLAVLNFVDAFMLKKNFSRLSIDEKICGAIVLLVFSIGISRTRIGIFPVGLFLSVIIILLCTRLCRYGILLCVSSVVGVGFAISYLDPNYISLFVVLALSAIAFKCNYSWLSAVSCLLSYVLFVFVFNLGFAIGEIISVVSGCVISVCIPNSILDLLGKCLVSEKSCAIGAVLEYNKNEVVQRIENLSEVFSDMDSVYRDMVRGNLSDEKAKELIEEEVVLSVCSSCPNKDSCLRNSSSYMQISLKEFLDIAYEKKKAYLIDVPEYMTTNCTRVNQLLMTTSNLLSVYQDYSNAVTNIDTSRMLIADQLSGVSGLLKSLAKEVDLNVSENYNKEKMLLDNLNNSGISCCECSIYEKDSQNSIITIIANTNMYNDKKLLNVVNKTTKSKYQIVSTKSYSVGGVDVIILQNQPNYDISFGSSVVSKTGQISSGDNHMVVRIDHGKYMVSICDGMGSGNSARDISLLTIRLIENFYKAGFDNEIILNSVNKLLSLTDVERFSTIDLCIIDGKRNIYDFIKLGATNGYLRRANGIVEVIESSGLPVGVLENIRPHITKKCISAMDILVLVSDGVTDVLGDELEKYLVCSDTINPQTMSEEILAFALEKGGDMANDDMTVVCVRVFECV
ncbi:MAG: SpoIIE family protein phosphatase [Clostridia bacterium]|nr:SpoIIE family protein phosphatase [Clostridia bacterium]